MARSLKSLRENRNIRDFIFQIGFDFVAQLRDIMGDEIGRAELAKKLGVSKGRVSQVLNNPGNLTMMNVVQYPRALGYKVAVVVYDDSDPHNKNGPILPQIFAECWARNGRPRDFFELQDRQQKVVMLPQGSYPMHTDIKSGNAIYAIRTGRTPNLSEWNLDAIKSTGDNAGVIRSMPADVVATATTAP